MNVLAEGDLTLMPRRKAKALRDDQSGEVQSAYHLRNGIAGKSCCGTACFVARHLNHQRWETAVGEEPRVHCLGKCYVSPAADCDEARPRMEAYCRTPVVLERLVNGNARSFESYVQAGGYSAIERAVGRAREDILRAVEDSQLRGRGGAAFPAGTKWRMAAKRTSEQKFIIANADEGDPGAYIDRFILEEDPHALIEGMALAAYAVGATQGWIFLRTEYPAARVSLEHAIAEARRIGVLGSTSGYYFFDIELVVGAGSYICGEETALINSLEGKRPVAMARPPYATDYGLFGKPTVINNVETLATIPWIIRNGAETYRAMGFSKSRGTKLLSLNSLFNRPGLYEVEFGIPVREIVEHLGGGLKTGELRGLLIGGPLAGILPPTLLDTPLGFEELRVAGAAVGHGGVVAFDKYTTIPQLIHHVFSFGAYESCGKCTPCRLGAQRILELFQDILTAGHVSAERKCEWEDIIAALKLTSLCGLGMGLAEFAESISRHYGRELAACFR